MPPGNPATLFVSLGTSPAVVPEAFLLPEVSFKSVHVLTTEKPDVSLIREFFDTHHPQTKLSISRVEGFEDFESEADHFRFEEILYRWILNAGIHAEARWFCLSGGFKTMSASMQKAANLFGAAGVFHVLSKQELYPDETKLRHPGSISEILQADAQGKLQWIQLGAELGWPQLRRLRSQDYSLKHKDQHGVHWLSAPDHSLRDAIAVMETRVHAISRSWETIPQLPFNELATWPEQQLAWLNEPLDPCSNADREWVASLPKLELHCHLGGFATHEPLLSEVESSADNESRLSPRSADKLAKDWPVPAKPIGLEPYRKLGDDNGSRLLRDPGCLRKQCELLYRHFLDQNILYAEVRCSPANYADSSLNRSPWNVLSDIREAFQSCMSEASWLAGSFACHVNLIIIGTRQSVGDYRAGISRHLALAVTAAEHWKDPESCRVVGVDLAGFENPTTRAHYFREEFTAVHRCGLALTAHAGENDDAEGIWRAVFDLNARRLGHALSLAQSPDLMKSVADRGIGIEMCPYANVQIKGFDLDGVLSDPNEPRAYPLLGYLRHGLKATVNTDNIGISAADLTENLLLAGRLCPGLTRMDLLRLQRNAVDTCFEDAIARQELLARINATIRFPSS